MAEADDRILAKSAHGGRPGVTLAQHARDTVSAFRAIFGSADAPTPLGEHWLRFFRLESADFESFFLNSWISAACHDIGKANDGFQRMVRVVNGRQLLRHEHLSALLLWEPTMREWLHAHAHRGVDAELIAAAVVSHHLKVDDGTFATQQMSVDRPRLRVLAASPDVEAVVAIAAEPLAAAPPSLVASAGEWSLAPDLSRRRELFLRDMHRFKQSLAKDDRRRRLLLAVKASLIVADSAGSAMVRTELDLEGWLHRAFGRAMLTRAAVHEAVIEPRIRQLEQQKRWHGYHDFQIAAGRLSPRALLLAGCGAGKTLAAWEWIANQAEARQVTRALFLYPTRATATEGFRDYVSWAGPDDGALLSGTARYDLDGIFANAADSRSEGDYSVPERLFALAYWDRAVFSATVDSFLAFMTNRYAPLCLLPLLAESAIVIDEVHSFDRQMFKALERFLCFFDVPVLCMTASLPSDRLHTLRDKCGLEVFPADHDHFDDLDRQAEAPRYAVRRIDASEAPGIAAKAVRQGKRVLWVVNTVQRCQEAARQLREAEPKPKAVLCYHSRFRLRDRKQRHEDAVRRFRSEHAIALVTTQVCEMSLDLDADVLITETAPVPALIQRMGRCCREPLPRDGRLGEVCVYDPPGHRPYEAAEIAQGQAFAASLSGDTPVSQRHLNDRLEQLAVLDPHVQGGYAAFIDSGWHALSREDGFREDDDFVVDAVLDVDRESFLRARQRRDPAADGYVVPAPRKIVRPDEALGDFVGVVSCDLYTKEDGLRAT